MRFFILVRLRVSCVWDPACSSIVLAIGDGPRHLLAVRSSRSGETLPLALLRLALYLPLVL